MGMKGFAIIAASIAVVAYYVYQGIFAPVPVPKFDAAKYWGPSSQASARAAAKSEVKPFKIDYSAEVITKLRNRLAEPLNLVEPLENVGFRYGFNKYKLEELIKYWRDDYLPRWNERQQFLNGLPQFTTTIQGLVCLYILCSSHFQLQSSFVSLFFLFGRMQLENPLHSHERCDGKSEKCGSIVVVARLAWIGARIL